MTSCKTLTKLYLDIRRRRAHHRLITCGEFFVLEKRVGRPTHIFYSSNCVRLKIVYFVKLNKDQNIYFESNFGILNLIKAGVLFMYKNNLIKLNPSNGSIVWIIKRKYKIKEIAGSRVVAKTSLRLVFSLRLLFMVALRNVVPRIPVFFALIRIMHIFLNNK